MVETLVGSEHVSAEQGDPASRAEALQCAHDAVETYRTLAQALPAVNLPYLATSLNSLANHLSQHDDSDSRVEELPCARPAVET